MNSDTEKTNIELRSEKVRRIVGRMPKHTGVTGAWILVFLYIAFFAAVSLIPYP